MEWSSVGAISLYSETGRFVGFLSREYYDGCMIDRNRQLVESAGILLAVYDGSCRSGTGATVQYARKIGREVMMIDPITRLISHA